jgi:hypothetical protein
MSQRLQCLVGVGGSYHDDPCPLDACHRADKRQAAALRRLVDEEERAVVLTAADGFCEGLFQILGNDYLLWIHLLGFSRRVGINGCKGKKKTAKCKEKSEKNAIALNFFPLTASKGQIFVKNQ